jgi:hypothetical protein
VTLLSLDLLIRISFKEQATDTAKLFLLLEDRGRVSLWDIV